MYQRVTRNVNILRLPLSLVLLLVLLFFLLFLFLFLFFMFLVALVFSFLFLFLLFLFLFLLLVFNIPEIKQREWVRLQKNCLRSASFESRRGPNLLVSKSSSDVLRQRPAVCRHKVSSNVHLIPNVPRNLEAPHQHLQLIICQ